MTAKKKQPKQKPRPQRASLSRSAGSALWAVSVVMVRHKENGRINVMNSLQKVKAQSEQEAVGFGVEIAQGQFPEHMVHCVTRLRFDTPNK